MKKIILKIEGMTCSACSSSLEKSILERNTLAGVPVLNLRKLNPKRFNDSPKNIAGKIPSGPLL